MSKDKNRAIFRSGGICDQIDKAYRVMQCNKLKSNKRGVTFELREEGLVCDL